MDRAKPLRGARANAQPEAVVGKAEPKRCMGPARAGRGERLERLGAPATRANRASNRQPVHVPRAASVDRACGRAALVPEAARVAARTAISRPRVARSVGSVARTARPDRVDAAARQPVTPDAANALNRGPERRALRRDRRQPDSHVPNANGESVSRQVVDHPCPALVGVGAGSPGAGHCRSIAPPSKRKPSTRQHGDRRKNGLARWTNGSGSTVVKRARDRLQEDPCRRNPAPRVGPESRRPGPCRLTSLPKSVKRPLP